MKKIYGVLVIVFYFAMLPTSFASTLGRGDAGKKQLEAPEKLRLTIVNVAKLPAAKGGSSIRVTVRAKVDAVYATATGITAGSEIEFSYITDTSTPRPDSTGYIKILPVVKEGQSLKAFLRKDDDQGHYTIAADGLSFGSAR